jgi:hypothetical protein
MRETRFRERRFFPERKYRLPLRWILLGGAVVLLMMIVAFMRIFR